MLDTDTRRRIDAARDILVGKVPDPKSQVEQITIALIYKFMDDMDAEAEELGGKRKFFTKEFARYGWAKLMQAGLGGHEMLGLYAEGITKMPENPGIPPLFRDIFKNAYLPYRDPETLKAFLKIIDEFTYDHSERLGDAFEYLLSVLGSQGDAGQFRTPRHIIDFIVEIIAPLKNETILDPACGTAGFLISAYKHIIHTNSDAKGHSKLTPDDKGRLAKNFKGYDISPDMVRLSLVNLYLHGFADPHIYEYDTLTSEERWNEFADVILANPPFMSPKGGIKPHKRFSVPSNRSEVLFVDYMIEHLTAHGRAGIIVPEGIIFQSGTAYRRLREVLLKDSLIGVISLPSGVFQPYSGVKTSVLILDKRIAKSRPKIMFSDVQAIGVSLGIKRTVTEANHLPLVLKDYAAYYASTQLSKQSFLVERTAVIENDYNLSAERYRPVEARAGTRVVKLKEICTLTKGTHSSTKTVAGPYPLIVTAKGWLTSADYQMEGETVCVPLISSTGHGRASINRIHFASGKFAVANLLAAIQPKDTDVLTAKFLFLVLDLQKEKMAGLMKGAANVSMKIEDLAEFQIPLPPLEVQKEIAAEIADYRQVINGASAVLDNYRPHIPIHPDWPIVPLEEACDIQRGKFSHRPRNEPRFYGGKYPFIQTGDVVRAENGGKITFTQTLNDEGLSVSKLFQPPVVVITIAANIGDTAVLDFPSCFPDSVVALIPKPGTDARFLEVIMRTKKQYLNDVAPQAAQKNINIEILKTVEIPLPSLATQRAIVEEIKADEVLVAANRELIARFEKKILATLSRIWGGRNMTIFDEFDQYSEEMLMAQYGISEIIRHELSKGQVREEFLLNTLASCSTPKLSFCKGTVADTKTDAGQLDLVLCRPHSRSRELGGYHLIEKKDALCVFEVKGNCTGSDLRDADNVAKKISELDGNTAPLYGVISYAVKLKEQTVLKRFGLTYDAANRTYLDAARDPNAKDPAQWGKIEYPNLDFFVSLEEGKKIYLRKYELTPGSGIFRFVRSADGPIMKNVFLMVNSLWREANQPQTQRSA